MQVPHWPRPRLLYLAVGGALVICAATALLLWLVNRDDPGDPRLRAYVHALPPVPVVFTSRTEPASLLAAAPEGEVYTYPGQGLWQAREGRLRLLTPQGTVHELTWGKPLPDGGTLIDVMGPTLSLDGTRILFAGRKGGDDPGHFRVYEIGVNGQDLHAITGGADDEGCTAVPPMRYDRAHRQVLDDATRRRVDYDDIDPCYFVDGSIVFASSRTPDLGRGHARRATNLWMIRTDGSRGPITSNRNNDRWPFTGDRGFLMFSLWSRNTEVITANETDIEPYETGKPSATLPTNAWLGAALNPKLPFFGDLVKTSVPVWRPRPLFNGHIAFMTEPGYVPGGASRPSPGIFQVIQAEAGLMDYVPSARPKGSQLPRGKGTHLFRGPSEDDRGRSLSVATPSPCPPDQILLAAAPVEAGQSAPLPGRYGLYLAGERWSPGTEKPVPAGEVGLRLLFDDPEFVDAEPVAVYPRLSSPAPAAALDQPARPPAAPAPASQSHDAYVQLVGLYTGVNGQMPGQETDRGAGPIFDAAPAGTLSEIRFYESLRDRFDDPDQDRVKGAWRLARKVALGGGSGLTTDVPAGVPLVLAGFTKEGRVAKWTTSPADSQGRRATFYAFAGDHYSGVRPGGAQFCTGCHPGHSGPGFPAGAYAERLP